MTLRTDINYLGFLPGLWRHIEMVNRGYHPIYVQYPARPTRRYGWGSPAHAALQRAMDGTRDGCRRLLDSLAPFTDGLRSIPLARPEDAAEPFWRNKFVRDLDVATLYAFPKLHGSRRYIEIGSGNSTRVVRRSIRDHGLDLRVTSVDPSPRAQIDALCDEVVREGLEHVPLELFESLDAGDILMFDGTHLCFQGSDVTVFFLEILPRLRPGVLVYIDDVYLPHDYPPGFRAEYYSEQYLLAVLLLSDRGARYEILFPSFFTWIDPELRALTDRYWEQVAVPGLERSPPNGFWMRVRA